jgi:hypothetical protein
MNYILLVVILAVCGAAYYTHTQDQQQISALQAEVDEAQAAAKAAAAKAQDNPEPVVAVTPGAAAHPGSGGESAPTGLTHDLDSPAPTLINNSSSVRSGPHAVVVDNPDEAHAGSVDAAAEAARAAADSDNLGTVTTLDNHSYTNCHVVKIDQDGVTFSNDAGITKIEYAMMPPDLQKKFGYTPQGAVARTEAEIRADEQEQSVQPAATNAAPATP